MKCRQCGANMKIENNFCPYCGTENTEYKIHRRQMFHIKRDYEETKDQVIKQHKKIAIHSVKITVIAVLAALNLLVWIFVGNAWSIISDFKVMSERPHVEKHRIQLEEYETKKQYVLLATYYDYYHLNYLEELEEFSQVYYACNQYEFMLSLLMGLINGNSYMNTADTAAMLSSALESIYDAMEKKEFSDPRCFEGGHGELLENLRKDIAILLVTYFDISSKEAEEFHRKSRGERQMIIERGIRIYED